MKKKDRYYAVACAVFLHILIAIIVWAVLQEYEYGGNPNVEDVDSIGVVTDPEDNDSTMVEDKSN